MGMWKYICNIGEWSLQPKVGYTGQPEDSSFPAYPRNWASSQELRLLDEPLQELKLNIRSAVGNATHSISFIHRMKDKEDIIVCRTSH